MKQWVPRIRKPIGAVSIMVELYFAADFSQGNFD